MQIIDLSYTMENNMPAWPGEESPEFEKKYSHDKDGVQVMKFSCLTHSGTHLDAPNHFFKQGKTLDQLPVEQFFGKGILLDCSMFGEKDLIPADQIKMSESKINEADFVLIYTGWDRYWGHEKYFGHFPVLSPDASKYLTRFNLKGIGLDLSSIDGIDSTDYPNHNQILGSGMIIIENLTNVHLLKNKPFNFAAFPLKIKEGDGSPVRAVAMID